MRDTAENDKVELLSEVLPWTNSNEPQELDDQQEPIYNSSVRTLDLALKTSQQRWMIETNGERGPGKSILAARHEDDSFLRELLAMITLMVGIKIRGLYLLRRDMVTEKKMPALGVTLDCM